MFKIQQFWRQIHFKGECQRKIRQYIKSVFSPLQKQPPEVFCKKVLLEISQNSQKNAMCQRHFFNNVAGLSLSQVFSYFTEHLWATASTIKVKVPENCSNSNNQ